MEKEKKAEIGDWVIIDYGDYGGAVGYVVEKDRYYGDFTYKITLLKNRNGQKLKVTFTFPEYKFTVLEELEKGYDTNFLIDLALKTKDKVWFSQLLEAYQQHGVDKGQFMDRRI